LLLLCSLAAETAFGVLIFLTDGWISEIQRHEISVLEKRIAPRELSEGQQKALGEALTAFSGKTVLVTTYMLDFEAVWFAQQIIQGLGQGGIKTISALACEGPVGALVVAVHVTGTDTDLVNALLKQLDALGVRTSPSPVPPSGGLRCTWYPPLADATIFVATKLPPQ